MGMFGARGRRRAAVAGVVAAVATLGLVGTAQADDTTPGTPCSAAARACVDLDAHQAWLIDGGSVVRGPVPVSSGGPGRETPRGVFGIEWKHRDHRSAEFDGAPMPFAAFFAPGGIAFHEGSLASPSAGCVRLVRDEAAAFFDFLQVGDRVEVV
jgi:lipoprotein-anchoring transpeptidase ErfK/SrfK